MWLNSNFRALFPCSPACLNGQDVAVQKLRQAELYSKIMPKFEFCQILVHTFERPHRSASDSNLPVKYMQNSLSDIRVLPYLAFSDV